jgi:cytochrome oxidase Cu insertion factor (SCO1/SenC/PrrC family)
MNATIPSVPFFDETGLERNTSQLKGSPSILVPIYTRCRGSCPKMAASLKSAILKSDEPAGDFHVVLFSIDPRDTAQDMKMFREHEQLPIQWLMARASADDTSKVMDAVGFHYTASEGQLLHPNIAAVLNRRLEVSQLLRGETYTSWQVDHALENARGHSRLQALEPFVLGIALLMMAVSAGAFFHSVMKLGVKPRRSP